MVSTTTTQLTIVRRAKYPQQPLTTRYKDARKSVKAYLTDAVRSLSILAQSAASLEQKRTDPSLTVFQRDDALKSLEVINSMMRMANQLSQYTFLPAPPSQPKMVLSGVEIAITADLLVTLPMRNGDVSGAALLRMSMDDAITDAAKAKRKELGLYTATLVHAHARQHLGLPNPVHPRACLSIDVQHGEVFEAPTSTAKRFRELESACVMIAALWPGI